MDNILPFLKSNWPEVAGGIGVVLAFVIGYFKGKKKEKQKAQLLVKDLEISSKDSIIKEKEKAAKHGEKVEELYDYVRSKLSGYTD